VNNKRAFSEALYILMNGTGVGFSCERQEVAKLPPIPSELKHVDDVIVVGDSKLGWAKSFKKLLSSLWEGDIPSVDYSKVRPAGARLVTFGGRASGPEPLRRLFDFTVETFKRAKGRKLNSLEVHDMMCMIGEIVVVGGVRRSALISLSNLSDRRMAEAKSGAWWEANSQRSLANNSVAYTEKPDATTFLEEWTTLVKSKSGERGIFNREASLIQARKWGRRSLSYTFELEDGTKKTFSANEYVKTSRGDIPAYKVKEDDEIL
jgi:ribonucleoside-diphosphate reductase alpha chain